MNPWWSGTERSSFWPGGYFAAAAMPAPSQIFEKFVYVGCGVPAHGPGYFAPASIQLPACPGLAVTGGGRNYPRPASFILLPLFLLLAAWRRGVPSLGVTGLTVASVP